MASPSALMFILSTLLASCFLTCHGSLLGGIPLLGGNTPTLQPNPNTSPYTSNPTLPPVTSTPTTSYLPNPTAPTLPTLPTLPNPTVPTLPTLPNPTLPSIPIGNPLGGVCPINAIKLNVCANVLSGLLGAVLGGLGGLGGGLLSNGQCCSLIGGLVDVDAAVCVCTGLKANVLGVNLNVPLCLNLLLNDCGKLLPSGFIC